MTQPMPLHSRTTRPTRRLCALAVLMTGLLGGSMTAPAVAHDDEPLEYVAFGDSYTSGIGAPNVRVSQLYFVNPADPADPRQCFQASPGYVDVLNARANVELVANAACGGSPAALVPGQVATATDRGLLNKDTDLVTITAGGIDVNFGGILATCMGSTLDACKAEVKKAEIVAKTEVRKTLANAYETIRERAPHATIVVLGYPHLFSPEFGDRPYITAEAAQVFNDGTDTFNRVIRQASKQVRGTVYVDVTDEFDGHGIGSPYPWINFIPQNPSAIANFHPNTTGYEKGYARAVIREAGIWALVH